MVGLHFGELGAGTEDGGERDRDRERGLYSPSQGIWPQNGVRCCPNGNRNGSFSKVGPHVSESIDLSPMLRLENIKCTFCPESNLGQFLNWL